jgi:hypothetical protein
MEDNTDKPVMRVRHSDLTLAAPEQSRFKTVCPVCTMGVLPVRRNPEHVEIILETDMCLNCGQQFIYVDIEEVRTGRKAPSKLSNIRKLKL